MAPDEAVRTRSAERLKLFTDAVVAIAMTLLILPLLESVSDVAGEGGTAGDYLGDHADQLQSFALSFVVIASFWSLHRALYEHVERATMLVTWLDVAWMATIVWLPVPTAMAGSMDTDALQEVLYIGTMLVSCALLAVTHVVVRRTPATWSAEGPPTTGGEVASITLAALFALALVLALAVPGLGYGSLFVLFLMGPIQRVAARRRAYG